MMDLRGEAADAALHMWPLWARDSQIASLPATGRCGCSWLDAASARRAQAQSGCAPVSSPAPSGRIALVARTPADVRDVMIEGDSGLLNICPSLEPAQVRAHQATPHVAQRRVRAGLLKPRAGPAPWAAVRRGVVRRTGNLGVLARDVGQPRLRPAPGYKSTVRGHDNAQADRAAS